MLSETRRENDGRTNIGRQDLAGIEDMASAGCGCAEIVAEMGRLGVGIEVETLRRYMANNRITISNGGKV